MLGIGLALTRAALPGLSLSFGESWTSLDSWSSGTFSQISSGRLYSNGSGGSAGANHSFATRGGKFRAVFNLQTVSGLTSGGLVIGVSKSAPGSAAPAGASAARGMYFRADVAVMDDGTVTSISGSSVPAGTVNWLVVVASDGAFLTITARTVDGTSEYRTKWAVDNVNFPVNNIYVFNSDSRQINGHSIGAIGARSGYVTYTPRAGIEDIAATATWTSANGKAIRVVLPASYDSRKPSPLAIMFHGNGSDETHWQTNANGKVVADALTAAGYIVLSAANTANTSTWGAQAGLDAYYEAYGWAVSNLNFGPIVLYANSMGGIESLLTLADSRLPTVYAWCGTSPAADLAKNYANATLTSTINTAYGIDGSHLYAAQTAGHDPMLMAGNAFRGVPMLFLAASDDVTVPKADNTDPMAAKVTPYAASVQVIPTTGGHSFDFSPYTGTIVDFFNAAIA